MNNINDAPYVSLTSEMNWHSLSSNTPLKKLKRNFLGPYLPNQNHLTFSQALLITQQYGLPVTWGNGTSVIMWEGPRVGFSKYLVTPFDETKSSFFSKPSTLSNRVLFVPDLFAMTSKDWRVFLSEFIYETS